MSGTYRRKPAEFYEDRNDEIMAKFLQGEKPEDLSKEYWISEARIRQIVGLKPYTTGGRQPHWRCRLYCSTIGRGKNNLPAVWFRWFVNEEEARRARPTITADLVLLQFWDDELRIYRGGARV